LNIGFVGLGIMGSRMAANLLRGGHKLWVYNRTQEKGARLQASGAQVAPSVAEVARHAEVIISMLSDPAAVRGTATGPSGFLARMEPGTLWIDCSTVNPKFSREMSELAAERGVRFIDAPVAGSKVAAEKGELAFLVGGTKSDVDEIRPLLELMGKKITHVGAVGMGTSMKLVVNLMLANAMASFTEAAALGGALGIPSATLFDTLLGGGGAAPFLASKRQRIESGNYEADFPLRLMRKDLHLAALEAFDAGIALPSTNAVKELFGFATRSGMGDLDFSALFDLLNERNTR